MNIPEIILSSGAFSLCDKYKNVLIKSEVVKKANMLSKSEFILKLKLELYPLFIEEIKNELRKGGFNAVADEVGTKVIKRLADIRPGQSLIPSINVYNYLIIVSHLCELIHAILTVTPIINPYAVSLQVATLQKYLGYSSFLDQLLHQQIANLISVREFVLTKSDLLQQLSVDNVKLAGVETNVLQALIKNLLGIDPEELDQSAYNEKGNELFWRLKVD